MSRTEIIISVFGLFLRVKLIKTIKLVATLGNSVCLEIFDHIHQKVRPGSFSSFLGYLPEFKKQKCVDYFWMNALQKVCAVSMAATNTKI